MSEIGLKPKAVIKFLEADREIFNLDIQKHTVTMP